MNNDIDRHKRYWVFEIPHYYPEGGLSDIILTTDDKEEIKKYIKKSAYEVFDSLTKQILNNKQ